MSLLLVQQLEAGPRELQGRLQLKKLTALSPVSVSPPPPQVDLDLLLNLPVETPAVPAHLEHHPHLLTVLELVVDLYSLSFLWIEFGQQNVCSSSSRSGNRG